MNKLIGKINGSLLYIPDFRQECGSINATILFSQLEYWFNKTDGKSFYKFLEPCDHELYKPGDSWTEELAFSPDEFRCAFLKLGIRYQSKKEFLAVDAKRRFIRPDGTEAKYCSYTDKLNRVTIFIRNNAYVDNLIENVLSGKELPQNSDIGIPDLENSKVGIPNLETLAKASYRDWESPYRDIGKGNPERLGKSISNIITETTTENTQRLPKTTHKNGMLDISEVTPENAEKSRKQNLCENLKNQNFKNEIQDLLKTDTRFSDNQKEHIERWLKHRKDNYNLKITPQAVKIQLNNFKDVEEAGYSIKEAVDYAIERTGWQNIKPQYLAKAIDKIDTDRVNEQQQAAAMLRKSLEALERQQQEEALKPKVEDIALKLRTFKKMNYEEYKKLVLLKKQQDALKGQDQTPQVAPKPPLMTFSREPF